MSRTRLLNQATDLLLEALWPHGGSGLDTRSRAKVRRALALVMEAVGHGGPATHGPAEPHAPPEGMCGAAPLAPPFLGMPDAEGVLALDEEPDEVLVGRRGGAHA